MGKSAKLHKRTPKSLKKPTTAAAASAVVGGSAQTQAQSAKKKAGLKKKVVGKTGKAGDGSGVLGGADYVSLMMGSRKRAQAEAAKLPHDQ